MISEDEVLSYKSYDFGYYGEVELDNFIYRLISSTFIPNVLTNPPTYSVSNRKESPTTSGSRRKEVAHSFASAGEERKKREKISEYVVAAVSQVNT